MLVDVDLEALAVAAVLPVGDGVADVVEERTAAKIEIANQHATQVADMADVAAAKSKGAEEFERGHHHDEGAHAHLDGDGEHDDLAVRKKDGAGEQDAKDSAGRADGGDIGRRMSPEDRHGVDDDIDEASADAGQKVVLQEAGAAPDHFEFAAKHIEDEHVGEDVPEGGGVVQKKVGKGLPETQAVGDGRRNETKGENEPVVGREAREGLEKSFKDENADVGDDEPLDRWSDVEVEADRIISNAGAGGHDNSVYGGEGATSKRGSVS